MAGRRGMAVVLASVLALAGLAACGSDAAGGGAARMDSGAAEERAAAADEAGAPEDEAGAPEEDVSAAKGSAAGEAVAEEAALAEAAEEAALAEAAAEEAASAEIAAEGRRLSGKEEGGVLVRNNGSYFVRIGDDVWFRQQQPEIVGKISYGGLTFLGNPAPETTNRDGPPPSICRYDLKEGRYYDLIRDTARGFGPLYYADEKLYSMRAKGEYGIEIYRMNLDGSEIETVCAGSIADITENGTLVVSPAAETGFALYKNGKRLTSYETDYGWISYCGSAGDDIFFLCGEGDPDECFLHELSPDGTVTRLGRLPGAPTECQDFVYDEGKVYLLLARREGTARSVAERIAVKVIPGQEGSIEELHAKDIAYPSDENAHLLRTGNGDEVMIAEHCSGELGLSEGTWGDLVLYDSPYSAERLITDFIPKDPYETDDPDEEIRFVQALSCIGGTAFICSAVAKRAPEEDIGWRMAYRLRYFHTDFLRVVDFETGEKLISDGDGELLKYGL